MALKILLVEWWQNWKKQESIGEMVKKGFKLKRTLVYCAWDGEEPALLGSTEWAEDHQEELKQKSSCLY